MANRNPIDDPENPEWNDKDFARARPASETLPPDLFAALTRRRGRPKAETTKEAVTLRLDPQVIATFRANGRGWQTRMNDALKASASNTPIAFSSNYLVWGSIDARQQLAEAI